MGTSAPHFLLFSEAGLPGRGRKPTDGKWRFLLQSVDGASRFGAQDLERHMSCERLELLAVVRGLEALDQPSRVTLVTRSDYVTRGLRYGLEEWRANRWRWEYDGRMVPIKNEDLWRRVDQALKYHRVDCRVWRFDTAHHDLTGLKRSRVASGGHDRTDHARRGERGLTAAARRAGRWLGRCFGRRTTSAAQAAI
jgi:ribonuclease HI